MAEAEACENPPAAAGLLMGMSAEVKRLHRYETERLRRVRQSVDRFAKLHKGRDEAEKNVRNEATDAGFVGRSGNDGVKCPVFR